jgi:valyl-tRNA synthetase
MSEIPKAYEPQSVEDKWYDFWLKQGCFTANEKSAKPAYSIVIPPPNVTGMLHMGHVLNNTIQDILSRKARMDGKEVLWLPGTDHAGIATQMMVERQLKKDEKKSRHDLGREEFLKRVWVWKEKHGDIIINQLKKLGCSCDWTRERFTMDPEYSRCVQKVFVELYKKGLIYRGKRMVNWCPVSQTALSDEEVEMKPQKGFMYHFRVEAVEADGSPVKSANARPLTLTSHEPDASQSTNAGTVSPSPGREGRGEGELSSRSAESKKSGPEIDSAGRIWLTIATTRPETIPGDTAVAVNPKDPRYAHLIGQHIVRPLPAELPAEQKLIPIIGDEHVDFEFGTGVLKVTPAHDKADFDIGTRHKLPLIEVINADGSMNALAGTALVGLDRFKARKVAVELLKEQGVLVEEKPYENNVGFSQRADVPIEPRLSEQWFLKYPAVEQSKACVAEGRMKFHPDRWAKVYDHWLTNIQDWCISRQLWWGHRIPVWYFLWNGPIATESSDSQNVRIDLPYLSKEQNQHIAAQVVRPGSKQGEIFVAIAVDPGHSDIEELLTKNGGQQDPDVLDTWFSSWLWPFATMGWPQQTETLKKFYPTTDLVTGPDIIFFWVARMIMAGYEFMGEPQFALPDAMPFKNVYFTGIIRDKQGRKMSKTLGNSPDPLELIAKYGADALRFGTMRSAPLGQDVLFDEKDVELGRNFCNKLWNACRFRQMQGGEVQGEIDPKLLTADDQWILLKLDAAIREVSIALNEYKFSEATTALYRFFWSEYCDWYVEASKAVFFGTDAARKANSVAVIDFILSHTLRMFHPFVPFITEELWHGMGYSADMPDNQGGRTIMFATWPLPFNDDEKAQFGLTENVLNATDAKYDLVTQGRNLRRIGNIQAAKKVKYVFKPARPLDPHDVEVVKLLLNAEALEINPDYQPPKGTPSVNTAPGELFLPLEGHIDKAAESARLAKEKEKIAAEILKVQQKLENPSFTQKVPASVLQEHQQRLVEWQGKLAHMQAALDALQG